MSVMRTLRGHYQNRLKDMKKSNEMARLALDNSERLSTDILHCNRTIRSLKSMSESLQTKNSDYINDIVKMIESAVEYAVNAVLPMKKYKVELDYKPYRNNGHLKLYLIDSSGRKLPPKIIEGDMLNQVLSFSSITHITAQMGFDTVFYDEAFASANVRSLMLINAVIMYYTSMGIKFVFVTQNPILYAGLERDMIELVSDGTQIVDVKKTHVIPTQEEFDSVARVTDLFDTLTQSRE